jgi:predicted porin
MTSRAVLLGDFCMQKRFLALVSTIGISLFAAPACADGFSARVSASAPSFSASIGLNYTISLTPDLVVGGGVSTYVSQTSAFQIGLNFGVLYDKKVIENTSGFLEVYAGARVSGSVVPSFAFWFQPNAGLSAEFSVAEKTKLVGNLDLTLLIPLTTNAASEFFGNLGFGVKYALQENLELNGSLSGSYVVINSSSSTSEGINLGAKYTIIPALDLTGGIGLNLSQAGNSSSSSFGISVGATYTLQPQVKIGTTLGLSFGSSTNFSISIFGSFIQNPGTAGTPDTRLP